MKIYRHVFTVRGALAFPLDMLRYDACYPHSETDAHEIEGSIRNYGTTAPLTVTLVFHSGASKTHPTGERWRSFGWEVVTQNTERREW